MLLSVSDACTWPWRPRVNRRCRVRHYAHHLFKLQSPHPCRAGKYAYDFVKSSPFYSCTGLPSGFSVELIYALHPGTNSRVKGNQPLPDLQLSSSILLRIIWTWLCVSTPNSGTTVNSVNAFGAFSFAYFWTLTIIDQSSPCMNSEKNAYFSLSTTFCYIRHFSDSFWCLADRIRNKGPHLSLNVL